MKKLNYYLSSIAIVVMLFTSCSKEDQSSDVVNGADENSVVLTFNSMLNDLSNKAMQKAQFSDIPDCMDGTPTSVEITLWVAGELAPRVVTVDVLGDAIDGYFTAYSDLLKIKIANDGNDATEDSVDFTLLGFKVYAGADLLWLAPVRTDGAPIDEFAGYVERSLPFTETVIRGSKPYFDVEVLCFDKRMVNEYGYPFFDINQKEIFNFCLFGNFCAPDGRDYVANYSVDIWTFDAGVKGVPLYNDLTSIAVLENGVYVESPLCVALPDDPNDNTEEYYFEITLLDSPEYNSVLEGTVVKSAVLTENIAKGLFSGEDRLEYAHFFIGCDNNDSPPIFNDPEDGAKHYYSCLHSINGSSANGFANITLIGNELYAQIIAVGMVPGKMHAQHIHGFTGASAPLVNPSTCPTSAEDTNSDGIISLTEGAEKYGAPQLFLKNASDEFPTANLWGTYLYEMSFTIDISPSAGIAPLDLKTVVLHGLNDPRLTPSTYDGSIPVACGELMEIN